MVVGEKNHSVNVNQQNTILVTLDTLNVDLTPVKLIELCFDGREET